MKLIEQLVPYSKALVPVAVGVLLTLLAQIGIYEDMTVKEALTLIVTSALVWLVPNKKK